MYLYPTDSLRTKYVLIHSLKHEVEIEPPKVPVIFSPQHKESGAYKQQMLSDST